MLIRFGYTWLIYSLCIFSLAGALPAAAQPEDAFKLRVDVDLVTVEVSATDKDGNPARNLKKEDFRLFEDGKQQEILSFDEVQERSGVSPGEIPLVDKGDSHRGKTVLILFIDCAIGPRYVETSRNSAMKFVREHMGPLDLFAVGNVVSSIRILQNLTNDREAVLAAIEKSTAAHGQGMLYFDDLLRSLEQINYSIARLKGQKSIFLYSSAVFGDMPATRTAYNNAIASARKSNVNYYTIDPNVEFSGSNPATGFMPSMGRGGTGGLVPVTVMSLANESGGFAIYNTVEINKGLDRLDKQISNYYILGFQSSNPVHDGAFRKLMVKTDVKGITLKHRTGYQDRRPVDVLASSRQEKALMTALATPGDNAQLPIVFRPAYFYSSSRSAKVLVAARIAMAKMAFKKKGGQLGTDLNIMGVAYGEDGSVAARFSETLPVSFDKEKEAEFRKGNLAYRNYFRLRPGKYRLKLAASDESNNLGSAEESFDVPALPAQGLAASSLVIAEQMSRLPDLIQNLQAQMLDESDPLIYSGMQIEPRVDNRLPANTALPVLFKIYNIPASSDQLNLVAKPKLISEQGKEFALNAIPLQKLLAPTGQGEAVVAIRLPFKDVPPGKYRLVIETGGEASAETVTLQTDIEFTK